MRGWERAAIIRICIVFSAMGFAMVRASAQPGDSGVMPEGRAAVRTPSWLVHATGSGAATFLNVLPSGRTLPQGSSSVGAFWPTNELFAGAWSYYIGGSNGVMPLFPNFGYGVTTDMQIGVGAGYLERDSEGMAIVSFSGKSNVYRGDAASVAIGYAVLLTGSRAHGSGGFFLPIPSLCAAYTYDSRYGSITLGAGATLLAYMLSAGLEVPLSSNFALVTDHSVGRDSGTRSRAYSMHTLALRYTARWLALSTGLIATGEGELYENDAPPLGPWLQCMVGF